MPKSVVATKDKRRHAGMRRRPRSRVSLRMSTCVMLGATVALTAFRGAGHCKDHAVPQA